MAVTVHLAHELAAAVEVHRVGDVGLAVEPAPAGEDAVGADVHEPRTHRVALQRQLVRQQGVDLHGRDQVGDLRRLLHHADGVDHHVGADLLEQPTAVGVVEDLELDGPLPEQRPHVGGQGRDVADRGVQLDARDATQLAHERGAEHPGRTEDEQPDGS